MRDPGMSVAALFSLLERLGLNASFKIWEPRITEYVGRVIR
jgi:hypothetical protein